jgi:enamine deaminase RidA (YjgF/YER057c/UK114 family)
LCLANVGRIDIWHDDLPLLNEVWVQHFGKDLPARTVVGVAKLRENYLLEIEVVAYTP